VVKGALSLRLRKCCAAASIVDVRIVIIAFIAVAWFVAEGVSTGRPQLREIAFGVTNRVSRVFVEGPSICVHRKLMNIRANLAYRGHEAYHGAVFRGRTTASGRFGIKQSVPNEGGG
jgi:hypothetical protein